jgi:adenosine deaminase
MKVNATEADASKVDALEVDAMAPFLRGLPKAELHLHLEGTLEPELLFELAGRNHVRLPWAGIDEVRAAYAFTDLQSFLDVYYAACDALRTERDFHDLTLAYLDRVAADGARRVEVFFDPQTHTDRGVPMGVVVEGIVAGLEEGRRRHGISSGLIMCIVRHLPADAAMAAYEAALPFREHLLGLGMDSGEIGNSPARFVEVFERARADGLHLVAHAGEEGPPAYVVEALDLLRVERIDHGVRSIEDPDLLARLARDRVPLTVCPLSNVALRVVDRLEEHPLPRLLAAGVPVTINSDDPAYFGGYLGDNYLATQAALDLDADTMVAIARTSLEACFVDDAERTSLLAQLDGYLAACEPETAGGAA